MFSGRMYEATQRSSPSRSDVGPGLDRLALGGGRVVHAEVELAEDQQERGDRLGHPLVDRRPAAVDVGPPGRRASRGPSRLTSRA